MSVDDEEKGQGVGDQIMEREKAQVVVKAIEFAETLVKYYIIRDRCEGIAGELGTAERCSNINVITKLLVSMTEGIGAIVAMKGAGFTEGEMAVVGLSRTTSYSMVQLAVYLREVSAGIVDSVKQQVPPEVARRVDLAIKISDLNMKVQAGVEDDKPKVQA